MTIRIFFSLPLVNTTKEFSTVTELRISSVDESFHCLASLLTPGSLRISSVDESFHCIASLLTPSSLRISSVYESFHCMASLLTPGSLQVFYSSHFGGCEEVAGWGFWFVFPLLLSGNGVLLENLVKTRAIGSINVW